MALSGKLKCWWWQQILWCGSASRKAHTVLGEGGRGSTEATWARRDWECPMLASKWTPVCEARLLWLLVHCPTVGCSQQMCSQSTKEQLSSGDTSGYAAITVSAMLRLALVLCVSDSVEHNGPRVTIQMTVSWHGSCPHYSSVRQTRQKISLQNKHPCRSNTKSADVKTTSNPASDFSHPEKCLKHLNHASV